MRIRKIAQVIVLYLCLISLISLCSTHVLSQGGHKHWRNLEEDIEKCPYLRIIEKSKWSEVKGYVEHFGEQKEFYIMKADDGGKEFVFGEQIKHSRMPRWTLLINDLINKRPLYRYSGYINVDEHNIDYDVDSVAVSINECHKLNVIADLDVIFGGIPPTAFDVNGKRIDSIRVNDNCDEEPYRVLKCGGGYGKTVPLSYPVYVSYSLKIYDVGNPEWSLHVSKGKCSPYAEVIANALRRLCYRNYASMSEDLFIMPENNQE